MRWLIVLPFARPEHMGMDFRDELAAMGHEVRTFAYRRDKSSTRTAGTKAAYQLWILRRARARVPRLASPTSCSCSRAGRSRRAHPARQAPARHALPEPVPRQPPLDDPVRVHRALRPLLHQGALRPARAREVGLRNLHYLPLYCVPDVPSPGDARPTRRPGASRRRSRSWAATTRIRERLRARAVRAIPLRLWGTGWERRRVAAVRAMAAGGPVSGTRQARGVLGRRRCRSITTIR